MKQEWRKKNEDDIEIINGFLYFDTWARYL